MIRRDFEITDARAEEILDKAYDYLGDDHPRLFVDEEDPEITQDWQGRRFAKLWLLVEDIEGE